MMRPPLAHHVRHAGGTQVSPIPWLVSVFRPLRCTERSYAAMFAARRVRLLVIGGLIGRFRETGAGLAIVLAVRGTDSSFALAGLISAIYLAGSAITRPAYGRWIDRIGPARPLLVSSTLNVVALLALGAATEARSCTATFCALSVIAGATLPPLSTSMRTQWPMLVPDHVGQAYALDSLSYELALVIAPALIGVLGAIVTPAAGLVVAAGCGAIGTGIVVASLHPGTETEPAPVVTLTSPAQSDAHRALIALIALGALVAFAEGSLTVLATGVAAANHARAASGLLLGSLSVGTLAGAVGFGAVAERPITRRTLVSCNLGLLSGFVLVAVFGSTLLGFAVGAMLTGLALSPCLTKVFIGLRHNAPAATVTETLAWASLFSSAGAAGGQALAGALISGAGLELALWGPALTVVLAVAAAALSGRPFAALNPMARVATCEVDLPG
jgi:MFS family permease